jgi:hypothetical protein
VEDVRRRVENDELLFDQPVVRHGFARTNRDYDVLVDVTAAKPDGSGSYIAGRHRYRFTHCVLAETRTAVPAATWRESRDDVYMDYEAWERAGNPSGFVWGVNWADAYPGLRYVGDSAEAQRWSEDLGHQMHEVRLETNTFTLRVVFHDLVVTDVPTEPEDS